MGTVFIYKNKLFHTLDLRKKLRRLRIKKNEIEIVLDKGDITKEDLCYAFRKLSNPITFVTEKDDVRFYYWRNNKEKKVLGSINKVLTQEWLDKTNNGLIDDWIKIEL